MYSIPGHEWMVSEMTFLSHPPRSRTYKYACATLTATASTSTEKRVQSAIWISKVIRGLLPTFADRHNSRTFCCFESLAKRSPEVYVENMVSVTPNRRM